MSPAPIQIRITGESGGAVRAIDRTNDELRNLNTYAKKAEGGLSSLKNTLVGVGTAFLASGIVREISSLIKESTKLASDLTETQSKTKVIFGKSADDIMAWAKTTDSALVMSQREILDTVSGFDLLFSNLGLSAKQAQDWAKDYTELAGDISSFFNISTQEASSAISSAFKGEFDPLEKIGVVINDAILKQRAYNEGWYSGKGPLDAHTRALAINAELIDQTKDSQGDLLRTQGSAANQMRQFTNNIQGLKTTLGAAFTPLIEKYLPGVNDWLKDINSEDFGKELGERLLTVGTYIEEHIIPGLKGIYDEIKAAFAGTDADTFKDTLGAIGGAAEEMAGWIGSAVKAFDGLSPEAKENIALMIAAGTAISLASKNPVVKLGIDLVGGTVSKIAETIATSWANRMFNNSFAQRVFVVNWPPGIGSGGTVIADGDGKPGKGSRLKAAAPTIAGLAALAVPYVLDALGVSPEFTEKITGITNSVAVGSATLWVAGALGLSNPVGWVASITAGTLWLAKEYGRQGNEIIQNEIYAQGTRQDLGTVKEDVAQVVEGHGKLSTYTTGAVGTLTKEQGHIISDLEVEKGSRKEGDADEAAKRKEADRQHQIALNNEETARKRKDAEIAAQAAAARAKAEESMRKYSSYLTGQQSGLGGSGGSGYPAGRSARGAAPTTYVTNTYISVPGAGSPALVAREIDRYIRRSGDRNRVSVTA